MRTGCVAMEASTLQTADGMTPDAPKAMSRRAHGASRVAAAGVVGSKPLLENISEGEYSSDNFGTNRP